MRTTDIDPILFIKERLRHLERIVAADIGCGAGRYDFLLMRSLGKVLDLYCIDQSDEMLTELQTYLR